MESDSTQHFPCQALLGRQITAFIGYYILLHCNLFSLDTPGKLFYSSRREKGILITGHWSAPYPSSARAIFDFNSIWRLEEVRDTAETGANLASQYFSIGQRHIS
jgi:hypothetical protein